MSIQLVTEAIEISQRENRVVVLRTQDCSDVGAEVETVRDELYCLSDGNTDTPGIHDFWGSDIAGNDWRVELVK